MCIIQPQFYLRCVSSESVCQLSLGYNKGMVIRKQFIQYNDGIYFPIFQRKITFFQTKTFHDVKITEITWFLLQRQLIRLKYIHG